jgi:hypothetical protein
VGAGAGQAGVTDAVQRLEQDQRDLHVFAPGVVQLRPRGLIIGLDGGLGLGDGQLEKAPPAPGGDRSGTSTAPGPAHAPAASIPPPLMSQCDRRRDSAPKTRRRWCRVKRRQEMASGRPGSRGPTMGREIPKTDRSRRVRHGPDSGDVPHKMKCGNGLADPYADGGELARGWADPASGPNAFLGGPTDP